MKKTALITGIFGQDGSYLCELLTEKGYDVHGIIREHSSENSLKIEKYLAKKNVLPILHLVDLNNYDELKALLLKVKPNEIYHMAAFHVSSQGVEGNKDFYEKQLFDYNVKSTSNILSICYDFLKETRIVSAGSCLMFDNSNTNYQNENTPFNSKSLYGLAKIAENSLVKYYRAKGLHCSTVILYNHESSRRNCNFVTKKIITNMVKIKKREIEKFTLGNLDTKKDWGYAKDYVYGIFLMAQLEIAEDFILSSGKSNTIKDFIQICANILNIDDWQNCINLDSKIIDRKIDNELIGDYSKAKEKLKWKHTKSLNELVGLMVKNEFNEDLE